MSRIKKCIMGFLFFAIVMAGIYFYQDSSNEVQAETQVVNTDMLSLKFQVGQGTAQGRIRVVASVDSPNYSAVGFDIAKDDNEPQELTIDTKKYPLPERIKSSVEGMEYSFSPKVVDTSSEYFLTGKWTADPNVKYTVCAWVRTYEGDKICGQSRCITLNDLTATGYLNMSFELKEGCTLSKTEEDAYADIKVTYNDTPTTAKVISVNGSNVHVNVQNVDRTTLPSATKFVFKNSDDTECGSTIFRNLYTSYSETTVGETTTNTADTSWYEVYLEENQDEKEFVIATSADLYGMATDVTPFAGKTIYLCADIEANKGTATADGWDTTQVEGATEYNWPTTFQKFDGTFDGQGHTIKGVCAKIGYRAALFQHIGSNGVVQNFKLLNSYMEGINYNGSIAGRLDGVIRDVTSDAIVKGSSYIHGGFVGITYASTNKQALIENCKFSGSIYSPANYIGGIVGSRCLGNLKIVDCEVTGSVRSEKNYVGGILGGVYDLSTGDTTINTNTVGTINIENCKFQGQLTGAGECLGGLVGALYNRKETITIKDSTVGGTLTGGYNFGGVIGYTGTGTTNIEGCQVAGTVTTTNVRLGGVVGVTGAGITNITDCIVSGTLAAGQYFGGIVGRIPNGGQTDIKTCSVTSTLKPSANDFGGLVGRIDTNVATVNISENSYFAGSFETSTAHSNSGGLVGSIWHGATVNITDCHANSMTAAGDYCGGLVGAVVSATANIDNSYFNGDFSTKYNYSGGILGYSSNGNVKIDKCYFNGTYNTNYQNAGGIVGYITTGTVDVANSYFVGKFDTSAENAGGIVGNILNGTLEIEKSYFDGAFTSTTNYAGGIVGTIGAVSSGCDVTADIRSCYVQGSVSAKGSHIGGIVGRVTYLTNKTVSLTDCLNAASVSGGNWTGGLFGRTHKTSGTIKMTRCLNMGAINSSSSTSAGSAVGGADQAPTVEAVYAVINNAVSKACGNNTFAVTTCELKDITIGNGVTAEKIQTETLKDLFATEDSIWTIETTEGSTPKLNLTIQ